MCQLAVSEIVPAGDHRVHHYPCQVRLQRTSKGADTHMFPLCLPAPALSCALPLRCRCPCSTHLAQSLYQKVLSPLAITYEADIDRLHQDIRVKAAGGSTAAAVSVVCVGFVGLFLGRVLCV